METSSGTTTGTPPSGRRSALRCTSYAHGRQEEGPKHMVHCYALRSTVHTWLWPLKPEERLDGMEWPDGSCPMRLQKLDLTSLASRRTYWGWLIQNPLKLQKLTKRRGSGITSAPLGETGEWCCNERRARFAVADVYDPRDEEGGKLHIVAPQAAATTA